MIYEGIIYQHFNLSTIRNFLGGSPTSRGYNQYQHDRSEKQGGRRQTLILGFPPTFLHPIFNRTTYEFLRGVAKHVCCILMFYNCGFIPNLKLLFTDAHPTVEGEGGNRVFGTFLSSLWQQIIFKGDCLTIWNMVNSSKVCLLQGKITIDDNSRSSSTFYFSSQV